LHFVKGYVSCVKDRIYEIMTMRRLCEVVLYLPTNDLRSWWMDC